MNFLRRYVLHNLPLKLGSLAVAALLWTAIANEPQVEVAFQSPLEFRSTPQSLEFSAEAPSTVQVRVLGPASTLRQLSANDLPVTVDLAGFQRPGERSYALAVSDARIPYGVRVVQIVPAQVSVRFEARAERDLAVVPRIVGQPGPRYQLGSYQVFPPTVRVVGPESHIQVLESATTDPVDITGVIARSQFWSNAVVGDPLVRLQKPQAVLVSIQVERRK